MTPTRVTILDDSNSLSSRDVTIEQDVLPEIAGAFDASPETTYWADGVGQAGLPGTVQGLKNSPRTTFFFSFVF